jgi:hypothetical protein
VPPHPPLFLNVGTLCGWVGWLVGWFGWLGKRLVLNCGQRAVKSRYWEVSIIRNFSRVANNRRRPWALVGSKMVELPWTLVNRSPTESTRSPTESTYRVGRKDKDKDKGKHGKGTKRSGSPFALADDGAWRMTCEPRVRRVRHTNHLFVARDVRTTSVIGTQHPSPIAFVLGSSVYKVTRG